MPRSDFQMLMLPFLENLKEGEECSMIEMKTELIRFVELTDKEVKPFDPEKNEKEFQEAIVIARKHLTRAGLIENASEDGVRITSLGKLVLGKRLNSIDVNFLHRLPGYLD